MQGCDSKLKPHIIVQQKCKNHTSRGAFPSRIATIAPKKEKVWFVHSKTGYQCIEKIPLAASLGVGSLWLGGMPGGQQGRHVLHGRKQSNMRIVTTNSSPRHISLSTLFPSRAAAKVVQLRGRRQEGGSTTLARSRKLEASTSTTLAWRRRLEAWARWEASRERTSQATVLRMSAEQCRISMNLQKHLNNHFKPWTFQILLISLGLRSSLCFDFKKKATNKSKLTNLLKLLEISRNQGICVETGFVSVCLCAPLRRWIGISLA